MFLPFLLASAAFVAAQTTTSSIPTSTGAPCAIASAYLDAASSTYIPAQVAYDCLQSVPVNTEGDKTLIDELKIAWQWHSEIGWSKNTPEDWELGNLDIEAELDTIKKNIDDKKYASEYEVQRAIQDITFKTGNFHFNYNPDILQVFDWRREIGVVSLSSDGKSLPKLYIASDARYSSESMSEITKINDEEAWSALKKIAAQGQYIDTDGRLNKLFYKGDTRIRGTFSTQVNYQGETTKIEFANSSIQTYDNWAYTYQDFSSVTDGQSFFDAFCQGSLEEPSLEAVAKAEHDEETITYSGVLGPKQKIPKEYHLSHLNKRQLDNSTTATLVASDMSDAIAGYFLNGEGYSDIAVLKILTFAPDYDSTGLDFQSTIQGFLAQCIEEKKTKLIIDLRENGGGSPHLVFDAFMQLFPDMEPYSGQRYRAEEQFLAIGEAVAEIHNSEELSAKYEDLYYTEVGDRPWRIWAYWHFRTAKGENFKDWKSYGGPETFNGDNFTVTNRHNYSNSDRISILPDGFDFPTGQRAAPFNASNVVMFTDALCGSACAGFHEELKNIAGVKSVTVGGRPESKPIQPATGSKGGEVRRVSIFASYASAILNLTAEIGAKVPTSERLKAFANVEQLWLRAGDSHTRFQTQDQLRKGDVTATPLQFIYEAADCKFFYTVGSWENPDEAWKSAWDAFQDEGKCVEGSTKHESSISGGFVPYGPKELEDKDLPGAGGQGAPNPTSSGGGGAPPSATGTGTPKSAGERVRVGAVGMLVALVVTLAIL